MLKARNPFTPILFVTLNLPTSDEHVEEIEERLIQDLNSIGYLNEDATMFAPEMLIPAQSPKVSHTAVACHCHHWAVSESLSASSHTALCTECVGLTCGEGREGFALIHVCGGKGGLGTCVGKEGRVRDMCGEGREG